MEILKNFRNRKAQTAIEYLLLLTVTAVIVFIGFKTIVPRSGQVSERFFNKVANGIMDTPPDLP